MVLGGINKQKMNTALQLTLIIVIILYFIGMFRLLAQGKVNLRYSLLWICVGIVMMLSVLFPNAAYTLLHFVGVQELTNGIFAVALLGIVIITTSITSIISMHDKKLRRAIQTIGLLEKRIRELEGYSVNTQVPSGKDND